MQLKWSFIDNAAPETVILNTGKSFELKAIEGSQMSIEGFSRVSELMLRRT